MEESTAVSFIGVSHDNKENVPPAAAKFPTRLPEPANSGKMKKKKKAVVLSNGRPRQPLADITNLVHCRIGRCVADMNTVLLVSSPAVVSSRKRRAVDEVDHALKSANASKSLRMGFR